MAVTVQTPGKGTTRLRFKAGVAHEGTDYFAGDVAVIDTYHARQYVAQGRAEIAPDDEEKQKAQPKGK